ncbi:MAG: putative secreted protein, partial [Bryobacterales bacterium]|nr:putative secreted protein [Bryobacterales bacterium]
MRWLTFLAALCLQAQTADLLVTNATIYTADPAHPTASALAIKSGRIIYIGDRFQGGAGKTIDAKGATVVPGLIDSHVHMEALGDSLETLDLRGVKSESDAADLVRKAALTRKPGEWIRGRAWDQNLWPGKQFPTKESISKAAPNNP